MQNRDKGIRVASRRRAGSALSLWLTVSLVGCGDGSKQILPMDDAAVPDSKQAAPDTPDLGMPSPDGKPDRYLSSPDGGPVAPDVTPDSYLYPLDGQAAAPDVKPDASLTAQDAGFGNAVDARPGIDGLADLYPPPTEEQVCQARTGVLPCDPGVPATTVQSATGQPYLSKVEVTQGLCTGSSCASGCAVLSITGSSSQYPGANCDVVVTLTDGSQQTFNLVVTSNPAPSYRCCGYPLAPNHGVWTALDPLVLGYPLVAMPPGWDGGAITPDAAVWPVVSDGGAVPVDSPPPRF